MLSSYVKSVWIWPEQSWLILSMTPWQTWQIARSRISHRDIIYTSWTRSRLSIQTFRIHFHPKLPTSTFMVIGSCQEPNPTASLQGDSECRADSRSHWFQPSPSLLACGRGACNGCFNKKKLLVVAWFLQWKLEIHNGKQMVTMGKSQIDIWIW